VRASVHVSVHTGMCVVFAVHLSVQSHICVCSSCTDSVCFQCVSCATPR